MHVEMATAEVVALPAATDGLTLLSFPVCRDIHICKTDPSNNRDLYRKEFVPGVLASFFGDYLQGNVGIIKYITTRDLMPVPSGQLYVDISCAMVP